jgi:hypothetical protein
MSAQVAGTSYEQYTHASSHQLHILRDARQ